MFFQLPNRKHHKDALRAKNRGPCLNAMELASEYGQLILKGAR